MCLFTARLHVYQSTLIVLFITVTLTIMLSLLSDLKLFSAHYKSCSFVKFFVKPTITTTSMHKHYNNDKNRIPQSQVPITI